MPSSSVRVEARRRLVEMVRDAINDPDIDVFYGLPAPEHIGKRSAVWVGDIEGIVQERRNGPNARVDNFTMELTCVAGPGATHDGNQNWDDLDPTKYQTHDERVMGMVQAIDDMLAAAGGSRLENLHGGTACWVSNINGPNPRLYKDGPGSEAAVTVSFQSHLTPHT